MDKMIELKDEKIRIIKRCGDCPFCSESGECEEFKEFDKDCPLKDWED
jgi:hypothetical protein